MTDDDPVEDLVEEGIVDEDLVKGNDEGNDGPAVEGSITHDHDGATRGGDGGKSGFLGGFRKGAKKADSPDQPMWPSTGARHRFGARAGDAVAGAISTLVLNLMLFGSRVMPGSWKMWKAFWRAGLRGMYKSSKKVETIGHIMVGGEIKPVPLQFDHDENKYKTLADEPEWWETQAEADNEYRIAGSVPTVWASATANEVGSHLQAEVAEAMDLGKDRPLVKDATVRHTTISAGDMSASGNGQAMADGGTSEYTTRATFEDPGILEDGLVPLDWEGDARVVSVRKYYETYPSTEAPEKMDQQRLIGRLMEKDQDREKLVMKLLLIAGAIIVGALGVVEVLPVVLGGGGGGGGGGSIIPITLGWMGA